jgi:hypothetical protein
MWKKPEDQAKAIELRKKGHSIKEISNELRVAKSSVSVWVKKVELTKEQKESLKLRNPIFNKSIKSNGHLRMKEKHIRIRAEYQIEGKKLTQAHMQSKEIDFFAGIALYWAEGTRSNNKSVVGFSNTDIAMIKFFITFLIKYFKVSLKNIKVTIYYHKTEGLSITDIQKYWSNNLGIDIQNFNRPYLEEKRKVTGKRKNIFPYGVCNLRVNSTEIIQKIYGAIQEYIGCDFPVSHTGT